MSLMRPEVTGWQEWVAVENSEGTSYIPGELVSLPGWFPLGMEVDAESVEMLPHVADPHSAWDEVLSAVRDYAGRNVYRVEITHGYGVRSSAPGYLDATEWSVYETAEEANQAYWDERDELDENDRASLVRAAIRRKLTDRDMRSAVGFFSENAGGIVGWRMQYAAMLARAEWWFTELEGNDRARFSADHDDPEPDKEPGFYFMASVELIDKNDEGDDVESISSIHMLTDSFDPHRDPYARVIRAELALELMSRYREADPIPDPRYTPFTDSETEAALCRVAKMYPNDETPLGVLADWRQENGVPHDRR